MKYNYQTKITDQVLEGLRSRRKPQLIAAATGTGKTRMAHRVIRRTPGRVLVLAHNQQVLRSNFNQNLFFEFKGKEDIKEAKKQRVVIAIPQGLISVYPKLGKFDLIVVDEAHEYTKASMVQKIIEYNKKAKVLLLTATHFGFSPSDVDKHYFSAEEGFDREIIMEPDMEVLKLSVPIAKKDYNKNLELVLDYRIPFDTIQEHFTQIFKKIRSKYKTVPPTMIIARDIRMARAIFQALKNKRFSVGISVQGEGDSDEFDRFRNGEYDCLIVCRRGILGYDFKDLTVVVDYSFSRNLSRCIQVVGRLTRLGQNKKTYYKVSAPEIVEDTLSLCSAILGLFLKQNYTFYSPSIKSVNDYPLIPRDFKDAKNSSKVSFKVYPFSEYKSLFDDHGDSFISLAETRKRALTTFEHEISPENFRRMMKKHKIKHLNEFAYAGNGLSKFLYACRKEPWWPDMREELGLKRERVVEGTTPTKAEFIALIKKKKLKTCVEVYRYSQPTHKHVSQQPWWEEVAVKYLGKNPPVKKTRKRVEELEVNYRRMHEFVKAHPTLVKWARVQPWWKSIQRRREARKETP